MTYSGRNEIPSIHGMDSLDRSPDSITSPVQTGDDVKVLVLDEEDIMDARTMSPRRNSEEMERCAAEAKERLEQYVFLLLRHNIWRVFD